MSWKNTHRPHWTKRFQQRFAKWLRGHDDPHVERVIGCDRDTMRAHLERCFKGRMSWDNYAGTVAAKHGFAAASRRKVWHVDHITPKSHFYEGEARLCYARWNLRPMWAAENIRKSDTRLYLI